jgi:outer membrane lipoprotein-sorting protein
MLGLLAPVARGQHAEYIDPDESAAKAKQVLQQLINALGGQQYLQQRTSQCEGRYAQFGHNGETSGYLQARVFWNYPDKFRIEYGKKGNIADVFAGDQGWTLDRDGASEEPAPAVADFQESLKRNVNNLLRTRLNEKGMLLRYGGPSVVDLTEVEWVEITDPDERLFRLAVDRNTHLLVRSTVKTVDTETREYQEDLTRYTNYQLKDGVQVPMQVSRERDGRRLNQAFFESCEVNPQLPPDFFTKAALEKRYGEVGGKKKNK